MKVSELNEVQRAHLVWRLDHRTEMGWVTAMRLAKGKFGDLDLVEAFKMGGRSDRSAKIHARKVINFAPDAKEGSLERIRRANLALSAAEIEAGLHPRWTESTSIAPRKGTNMKISELNEVQRAHLVWRLDHRTGMGLLTAMRLAKGEFGDLDLVEAFKMGGRSDRSAKIHARKVINFAPDAKEGSLERIRRANLALSAAEIEAGLHPRWTGPTGIAPRSDE